MTDSDVQEFAADLERQGGAPLPGARLVYKTYGTLNADRSNAILYPTRFGGTHEQNEFLIRPGYALDPEKYFIVVPICSGTACRRLRPIRRILTGGARFLRSPST